MKIKLKVFFLTMLSASTILLPVGCSRNNENGSHEAAAQLFEKSLKLLSLYTDSIRTAPDSASVNRLSLAYEAKINAANFEFPPDTDLRLTEEENDSLIKMTDRLVAMRKHRLKAFAEPNDSVSDSSLSVPADSVVAPPSRSQHN